MCPERVCRVCGEPSRRISEQRWLDALTGEERADIGGSDMFRHEAGTREIRGRNRGTTQPGVVSSPITTSWTDCGHNAWRRGVVLDPFAGSGTTLAVAEGHARDSIGIDLDERNAELARERVGGLFLEVDCGTPRTEAIFPSKAFL